MTHHIEDHEIRGISAKTLKNVVVQTVVICMALACSYYGIMSKLEKFNSHAQLQDLQIETLRTQLKTMQAQIDINAVHIQGVVIDNERIKEKLGIND